MNLNTNPLLLYFGVNNHKELVEYIEKNPEDPKVKSLMEIKLLLEKNKEGEDNEWFLQNFQLQQ